MSLEPAFRGTVSSETVHRLIVVGVALVLSMGTLDGSAWAASSRGVNASGTVSCSISAVIKYKPAQTAFGSLPDKLTIHGTLSACTSTGTATVMSGRVSGVSTGGTNSCSTDWTSPIKFTIKWKATTKINATKGTLTSISTFNNGSNVLFTATGPASGGSYTGDTAHVSVTTVETSQQIHDACSSANGLKSAGVTGSTYLS